MQTKDFTDPDLAMAFIKTLQENNCVDVLKTADGTFRVNWTPNKMLKLPTGEEVVDEVWTKEDGTMIVCQDLEPEHAKNIIRMILRNDRKRRKDEEIMLESLNQVIQNMVTANATEEDDDDLPEWMTETPESKPVLH